MICRVCGDNNLKLAFDFGFQPYPNNFLKTQDELHDFFPLEIFECLTCGLGQLEEFPFTPFNDDYPYETKISQTYLDALKAYYQIFFQNTSQSARVLEIGCNDGSLLKILKEIGCTKLYGIEPVPRLAGEATQFATEGVLNEFFSEGIFSDTKFDVIIVNNVLSHVANLHDFMRGLKKVSHESTRVIIEVQNYDLIKKYGFWDTIYHEHYSYFDAYSLCRLFFEFGFDCGSLQAISSHAGSIRAIFSVLPEEHGKICEPRKIAPRPFCPQILGEKHTIQSQIISRLQTGKKIACFGAAAKGASFLNFMGLTHHEVDFCIDETPGKVGKFLPGSRIPVVSLESFGRQVIPCDTMIILPYNFYREISDKLKDFPGELLVRNGGVLEHARRGR